MNLILHFVSFQILFTNLWSSMHLLEKLVMNSCNVFVYRHRISYIYSQENYVIRVYICWIKFFALRIFFLYEMYEYYIISAMKYNFFLIPVHFLLLLWINRETYKGTEALSSFLQSWILDYKPFQYPHNLLLFNLHGINAKWPFLNDLKCVDTYIYF